MTIIFDLDYTLLDTAKFKKALANALEISEEDFKNYEKELKKQNKNYNLAEHLNTLDHKPNLEAFWLKARDYLFPESLKILEKLSQENNLILATKGDQIFQQIKLAFLKIIKYFSEVYFCETDKCASLASLKTSDKILIVNDNAKESIELKKALKKNGISCEIFLVAGPYSNNMDHSEKIRQLNEILKKFETKNELTRELEIK